VIWMDRIKAGRVAGTKLLIPPASFAERVIADGTPRDWATRILGQLRPVSGFRRATALFIGRYQPFHAGHRRLLEGGIKRVGQPALQSATLKELRTRILCRSWMQNSKFTATMRSFWGNYRIIPAPKMIHVFHLRDGGCTTERITVAEGFEAISQRIQEVSQS
jgi:hypothetical protein